MLRPGRAERWGTWPVRWPWVRSLRRVATTLKVAYSELRAPASVGTMRRVRAWTHGYRSEAMLLYRSDKPWREGYLSDGAQFRTVNISGWNVVLTSNRLAFHGLMTGITDRLPQLHGHAYLGSFTPAGGGRALPLADAIRELLRRQRRLIAKPLFGSSGGRGVLRLEQDGVTGRILCNGQPLEDASILETRRLMGNHVVTAFVEQAEYARRIYPEASNTLRVQTMVDPETCQAFCALAMHRFGTSVTRPYDGWGEGGLITPVDLESGRLGTGVLRPRGGRSYVPRTDVHPETGMPVRGVVIPAWATLVREMLEVADAVGDRLPYVAWDILVTDDGFAILEGNSYPSFQAMQLWGPVLDQPRIRRFFVDHGVVKDR